MPRPQFIPSLDPLEQRLTLSTFTTLEYRHAKADIRHALTVADRGGNSGQITRLLSHAAAHVPLGRAGLLPLWKAQLQAVSNGATKSVFQREVLLSLDGHLQRGVEAGAIKVKGPASRQIARPEVQAYEHSIVIDNLSGIDLQVTLTEFRSGRVVSNSSLSNGAAFHFTPPPPPSSSLPDFYRVEVTASRRQSAWRNQCACWTNRPSPQRPSPRHDRDSGLSLVVLTIGARLSRRVVGYVEDVTRWPLGLGTAWGVE